MAVIGVSGVWGFIECRLHVQYHTVGFPEIYTRDASTNTNRRKDDVDHMGRGRCYFRGGVTHVGSIN